MMRSWEGGALAAIVMLVGFFGCGDGDEGSTPAGSSYCEKEPAGSAENVRVGCDSRCPGGPDCLPASDPTLYAGAAVEDVTPEVQYVVVTAPGGKPHEFNPLGGDVCVKKGSCDASDITKCQPVDPDLCTWIAGFGAGRAAEGNADPTTVRCSVLSQGNTRIGLCAVDNVGWFYNEVERTREALQAEHPELGLDFLLVASTHVHETQDTMGIWGATDSRSGVNKAYNAWVRAMTVSALVKATAALEPVRVQFGKTLVDGHIPETDPGGHKTAAFVSDTRDPVVIDNELRVIRFLRRSDDSTVATLINFASHPEFAGSKNQLTSSDYVHTLREGIEKGFEVKDAAGKVLMQRDGVGGVALFFNGALGGQVGPGQVNHVDFEGNDVPEGLERAYNNGRLLAVYAHEALKQGVETTETAALGFRAREIYVSIANTGYHIALAQNLFDREGYFFDPNRELGPDNLPYIRSQIAVVELGPAQFVTLPGELHAELLLATPDGKSALDAPYPFTPAPYKVLNDTKTNPNCGTDGYSRCDEGPPDIAAFDRETPLDLSRDPKASYRWVVGLGLDQFGYIVPAYDFKLDGDNPYLEEFSPGEHYEETNSVANTVEAQVVDPVRQLLRSPPVVRR